MTYWIAIGLIVSAILIFVAVVLTGIDDDHDPYNGDGF